MATTPPFLDPEEARNLAITLGTQPRQLAGLGTPDVAAPGPISMPGQSKIPDLGIGQPKVNAPRGTVEGDQAERARQLATGPGVDQIYGKVTNSGFGQAHPTLAKILGGLGEGIAKAGDIGLTAVAPSIAMGLPGTTLHHDIGVRQLNKQIGAEEGEREKEAQTSAQQAEVPLRQAETEHARAETEALDNAPDKQNTLAQLHANAVNKAIQEGRDPSTDPTVQHLADAITSLQKEPRPVTPKGMEHVALSGPGGKAIAANYDPNTGKYTDSQGKEIANPQPYEKSPTVNVNAGTAALDREVTHFGKPYQTASDQANAKFDKINQTIHSVDAGYVGQGLAIPELLTSLVSGQGTGVRITQPELNAITAARGIKGDAEAFFNSLAGKGKLTDTDKAQIKSVLGDARRRLEVKQQILNDALDKINGAATRDQIVQADKEARARITQLEKFGHYEGETVTIKGKPVVINKIHPDGSFE